MSDGARRGSGRRGGERLVLLVVRREVGQRVRERSFLISTVLTALVLVGVVVVPHLLSSGPSRYRVATTPATVALGRAVADSSRGRVELVEKLDEPDARASVGGGEVAAALVPGPGGGRLVVQRELPTELGALVQSTEARLVLVDRLRRAGLDRAAVDRALAPAALPVQVLRPRSARQDDDRKVATVAVVLLYGQMLGYGVWVAMGVVEEKSSRVVEVVLSAIPARTLLTGKVLGIGLVGLGQLLAFCVVGLVAAAVSGALTVTASVLGTVAESVGFFILGYAFFASAYAGAAATSSRQEDLQNATAPLTLAVVASFIAGITVAGAPTSLAATVLSFVPPLSTLVMPPRYAGGEVPLWQVGVSALIMVLATAMIIRAAARVYEGAVLRLGARVSLLEAYRLGRRAEARPDGEARRV